MSFAEKAYLGSLDDVVARYPWGDTRAYTLEEYLEQSDKKLDQALLSSFNSTLQFNALFGRELLINDGYLLNHPAAKMALLDPPCSPLRAMLEGGRIQILRRQVDFDLAETALHMSAQNNKSFKMLSALPDWANFRQELRNISRISGVTKRWPKYDISQGMEAFLLSLREPDVNASCKILAQADIDQLIDEFKVVKSRDNTAPRDAWEKAARGLFACDKRKLYETMQLANTFYHMNFTLCLASETPSAMAVETMSTANIESLLERSADTKRSWSDIEEMKGVLEKFSGSVYFPGPKDVLDGEKLCQLYSGIRGSAGEAKLEFLRQLELFKEEQATDSQLDTAVRNYSEALQALFQPGQAGSKFSFTVDGSLREATKTAGDVGGKSALSSLIKGSAATSALDAGGTAVITSICIDFGKRMAFSALPYIVPPRTGEDSQFLKNIKNRNRLFNDWMISAPVSRQAAKEHVKNLRKYS